MSDGKKSIRIDFDAKTERELRTAATRRGIAVEQFCIDAVFKELKSDSANHVIPLRGTFKDGAAILRGSISIKESADALFALRDEISRGKTTSTDSADLIREARERRGLRQEELGRS